MKKKIVFCSDDGRRFDTERECLRWETIMTMLDGGRPNVNVVNNGVPPIIDREDLPWEYTIYWIRPTETSAADELSSIFDEDIKVNEWCCVIKPYFADDGLKLIKMSECINYINCFLEEYNELKRR